MDKHGILLPSRNHFLWISVLLLISEVRLNNSAECSGECPPGQYEAKPCTHYGNRVCKPCRVCEGAMYESRPCSPLADRHCIHAAHPLLISDEQTTPVFLDASKKLRKTMQAENPEWLKVEASSNVIVEDLHNTRNLETTFYVTDTTQASDFPWKRESGISVNIGILNVNVIPTYTGVEHESDIIYMKENKNQDRYFNDVAKNYCRHPIPDYYTLTLELYKDRTTSAYEYECHNENPAKPDCPEGYVNGDIVLHRELNTPCERMGTFPERLDEEQFRNELTCTKSKSLLGGIFNQTAKEEHGIVFRDVRCKEAVKRCDECFELNDCDRKDIFESQCCAVDCYTLADCKRAHSAQCTSFDVECAMGDAYRYALHPIYQNISKEFQCHIQHEEPTVLYEMFFFLEFPGGYRTPKVEKTVYANSEEFQSNGTFQADFITVEHSTGLKLEDEFILLGKDSFGLQNEYNYTVADMKPEEAYIDHGIQVHFLERNRYSVSFQFSEPFAYSVDTFGQGDTCERDISKFKPEQRHYVEDTRQNVRVTTESNGANKQLKYLLQSVDNPPFIRFSVPGNMSILPWYFKESGIQLYIDDSLVVRLELQPGFKVWNIYLSGRMTACPAYLGVTINNRANQEELIRQDLLITCPTNFNLTFHAPNIGQLLSRTFDVILEDSVKTYQVFLTHLDVSDSTPEAIINEPIRVKQQEAATFSKLLAIVCLVVFITFVLNKVYIITDMRHIRKTYSCKKYEDSHFHPHNSSGTHSSSDTMDQSTSGNYTDKTTGCHKNMSNGKLLVIVVYIVLRLLYSVLFTFTVFFGALMVFVRPEMQRLANLDDFTQLAQNETRANSRKYDTHWRSELLREAELVKDIQGACSFYVTELFDSMQFQMDNITIHYHQNELYGQATSLSAIMESRVANQMQAYKYRIMNFTTDIRDELESRVHPTLKQYKKYLSNMFHNHWLSFPQRLFNESDFGTKTTSQDLNISVMTGAEVDFGRYLELQDVDAVRLWELQFWERFVSIFPELPDLPVPKLNINQPNCTIDKRYEHQFNRTLLRPTHNHMDTERYFAPHLPLEGDKGPIYNRGNTRQEYLFVTEGTIPLLSNTSIVISEEYGVHNLVDLEFLWIIFISLDIILFIYRLCHTYMNATAMCDKSKYSNTYTVADYTALTTPVENQYYTSPHINPSANTSLNSTLDSCYKRSHEYNIPLGGVATRSNCNSLNSSNCNSSYSANKNGSSKVEKSQCQKPHSVHHQKLTVNKIKEYNRVTKYYSNAKDSFLAAILNTIVKIFLSKTLPKVLIGIVVLCICYVCMKTVHFTMNMEFFIERDLLSVYTSGLKSQINQTNWYLSDQAQYFNNVSMTIYNGQMRAELTYLESMLQYFDTEQERLVDNYNSEACAILHESLANWTCPISTSAPKLAMPVLPCNFIPIQPNLISDEEPRIQEKLLLNYLEPYLESCQDGTSVIIYALLICFSTVFIIHLIGTIFLHHMKTTNNPLVRHFYVKTPLLTSNREPHDPDDDSLPLPPPPEPGSKSGVDFPDGSQHYGTSTNYDPSNVDMGCSRGNIQTLPYPGKQAKRYYHGQGHPQGHFKGHVRFDPKEPRYHIAAKEGMHTYPSPRQHPSHPDYSSATLPLQTCDFSYSETKV